ncbi:MAG TPA: DinB family protein [Holophagaceae bacterium]|nr:DinB family protein [Holophagaceae bacterium]
MPPDTQRESFLKRYQEGPALLREAWTGVPEGARQWRPREGAWSAHEIVVHCGDSETYGATRIRLLLAEPEPLIVGYDENEWARRFDYHGHPVELAFSAIEAVRANTIAMLRRLPDAAWDKAGRHTQSGPYTTWDWLKTYAEHLEVHVAQIRRTLDAWRQH